MSDMVYFERECGYPGNSHMSELKLLKKKKEKDIQQDRDSTMTFITILFDV